ncbi:hypothetical protein C5C26_11080, partial [Rathayibacter sp. AY2B1]|uniref:hypothetical protein n=1 Tax=Rathayibacter sp. AY2B1 TaxID=2080568 RepID=UPI000D412A0B
GIDYSAGSVHELSPTHRVLATPVAGGRPPPSVLGAGRHRLRSVLPRMIEQGRGSVITTSSVAGAPSVRPMSM